MTVYVVLAIYDPDYEYTDYELRGVIAGVEGVYATRAEAESVKPGEQGFLTEISEWSLDLP